MFSLLDALSTIDTQICSKRKRRDFEIPVTFRDDRDVWVERLIELAVDAYQKRKNINFYLEASIEGIPELTAKKINKIERSYIKALNHFVACYVDFDARFIDELLPEKEIRWRAHDLFSDWALTDSIKTFERSAYSYFENLNSQNQHAGAVASTPRA